MDSSSSPSAKRRRGSSSCSRSRQVLCVLCYRASETLKRGFAIYFVDLASSSSTGNNSVSISPALTIDIKRFNFDTICVLGSTLYMFQSIDKFERKPELLGNGTSVATVDLSEYITRTNVELEDDMITRINPMRHPKRSPMAIPTPDGKLLVFSSLIQFNPCFETARPIDFELYDPATGQWKPLPRIYDNWVEDRKHTCFYFYIEAFGFLSESKLLVKTRFGMFDLELGSSIGWQDWVKPAHRLPPHCVGPLSVIDGELCFTPHCAFDINTPKTSSLYHVFPQSRFDGYYELETSCGTIQTLDDDGECNFWVAQTAINEDTRIPHLAIDVHRCDLAKFREDKQYLIAKYREDKQSLTAKYREDKQNLEENEKTAREKLKNKYREYKVWLELGRTAVLSTRLDKSFKFVLGTHRSAWFGPLSLSFVSKSAADAIP